MRLRLPPPLRTTAGHVTSQRKSASREGKREPPFGSIPARITPRSSPFLHRLLQGLEAKKQQGLALAAEPPPAVGTNGSFFPQRCCFC